MSYLNIKNVLKNKFSRLLVTDNDQSYLTISDFTCKDDGLWSYGFHIFKSIAPDLENNVIESKVYYPLYLQVVYLKKFFLNFYLFKNSNGLLIEFNYKNIINLGSLFYDIFIEIDNDFEIIEKNIKNIILEYSNPLRKTFGYTKLFVSVSVCMEYEIKSINKTENGLKITVECLKKSNKVPEIYFLYNINYDNLKKNIDYKYNNLNHIKSEHEENSLLQLKHFKFTSEDKQLNKAYVLAMLSASNFIMKKNNIHGIWAGFPWFDNIWGRDTFISIPGILLISGKYEDAKDIINTFYKNQCKTKNNNYGKIPNYINNKDDIAFNSADSTPLYIKSIYEYYLYTGDIDFIINIWDSIILAVKSIYIKNKNNNGFIASKDSEDWMDARKDNKYSYSPRGGYCIEIQAFWYTALYITYILGDEISKNSNNKYKDDIMLFKNEAEKLKKSILEYFTSDKEPFIYDMLYIDNKKSDKVRPNPLLAIFFSSLPCIPDIFNKEIILKYVNYISDKLIYLHGVSSLSIKDDFFHPVHINKNYAKDAAYHNGAIWLWLSGIFVSIACKIGLQETAGKMTNEITKMVLESNTTSILPEIIDPYIENTELISTGAFSQAWSISEYCRPLLQDYLGVVVNVPKRKLTIAPALPSKFDMIRSNFRYGYNESISLYMRLNKKTLSISMLEIKGLNINNQIEVNVNINLGYKLLNDKRQYHYVQLFFNIYKNDDMIRINFDQKDDKLMKIKEINNIGEAEIININTYKEELSTGYFENINFISKIEDINDFLTIKNKDYLEKNLFK